jgi:hypothetical protein
MRKRRQKYFACFHKISMTLRSGQYGGRQQIQAIALPLDLPLTHWRAMMIATTSSIVAAERCARLRTSVATTANRVPVRRPSRFDCRIQCQDIGLECNAVDEAVSSSELACC